MKWVKIRSWHAVQFVGRGGQLYRTYCGRWSALGAEVVDDLPAEKSCETCLRIVARQQDTA